MTDIDTEILRRDRHVKILRRDHHAKIRVRDRAGQSPLPHYVPDEKHPGRVRVTRPRPQFLKSRKEAPLIPGYEPGGGDMNIPPTTTNGQEGAVDEVSMGPGDQGG
jgi:hypothetical protein